MRLRPGDAGWDDLSPMERQRVAYMQSIGSMTRGQMRAAADARERKALADAEELRKARLRRAVEARNARIAAEQAARESAMAQARGMTGRRD